MRTITVLLATGLVYAQSGDWLLTTTEFGAPQYQRIDFKFDGEKITGRAGTLTYEGTLRDGRVAFESKRADGSTITKYSGTYAPALFYEIGLDLKWASLVESVLQGPGAGGRGERRITAIFCQMPN